MHKIHENAGFVLLLSALLCLAGGCINLEFASPGRKVNEPLYDKCCYACLWFNFWWCWSDDPSEVCKIPDEHAKSSADGYVYRPGYREIKISYSWRTIFLAFPTLGAVTPLNVTCYETKDSRPAVGNDETIELK